MGTSSMWSTLERLELQLENKGRKDGKTRPWDENVCHWWEWQKAHLPLNSSCDNVKLNKIPNNVYTHKIFIKPLKIWTTVKHKK